METREKLTLSLTPMARKLLAQLALAHGYNRSVMMEILIRDKARDMDRDESNWQNAAPQKQETAS